MALKASQSNNSAPNLSGNKEESNERHDHTDSPVAESGTDAVESTPSAAQPEQLPPAKAPAPGIRLGGLKLGQPAQPAASGENVPAPSGAAEPSGGAVSKPGAGIKLGGFSLGSAGGASKPSGNPSSNGGTNPAAGSNGGNLGLLDIASLDVGTESSKLDFERTIQDAEGDYLDQVPATAPDREIPEDMADHAKAFVKSLDSIYNLHNDREMFVSVVSKIMTEMQEDKSLAKLLAPEDANAIMRGMRQAAGMAQVKKQAATAKRKGGSKKESALQSAAMDSLLSVAGFDLSAL